MRAAADACSSGAGATCRPFNRGLRLDYFLASAAMAPGGAGGAGAGASGDDATIPRVHDAFICDADTNGVSDHAPVGVVLAL
jgi:exonuclease III